MVATRMDQAMDWLDAHEARMAQFAEHLNLCAAAVVGIEGVLTRVEQRMALVEAEVARTRNFVHRVEDAVTDLGAYSLETRTGLATLTTSVDQTDAALGEVARDLRTTRSWLLAVAFKAEMTSDLLDGLAGVEAGSTSNG